MLIIVESLACDSASSVMGWYRRPETTNPCTKVEGFVVSAAFRLTIVMMMVVSMVVIGECRHRCA
jgi:hypothetical protein